MARRSGRAPFRLCAALGLALVPGPAALAAAAAPAWLPVGPFGGEVRSLAADPRDQRIVYLGTAEGVLFRSGDGGRRWSRLEPGFPLSGMSLDNIAVDARGRVVIGYWEVAGSGGGVALSEDDGRHFELGGGISGESVRALALSPSDPDTWIAGSLSGVFRTRDSGRNWSRISPPGDAELRNVESVAVDPVDPEVVYAGTWHLPWKTLDGGNSWRPAPNGMIDDSDVFTMTVDLWQPQRLYATACTGIYSSSDGGARWSKVRGIPSSSRRTRSFAQDPEHPEVLYAGTTEGLWGTRDGRNWRRLTPRQLIVNAVLALPGGAVLLGTEEAGVLRSEDGASGWVPSNEGFSAHFVTRLLYHPDGRLLAGLHGGRYHGGVLQADGPRGPWRSWGEGLAGRGVLSLAPAGSGALAGTDDGVFVSEGPGMPWRRLATVVAGVERRPAVHAAASPEPGVYLAATDHGLLRSEDSGVSWHALPLGSARRVTALAVAGMTALAATPLALFRSEDAGRSWAPVSADPGVAVISLHVPRDAPHVVFAVTEAGLYKSQDGGNRFSPGEGGLPRTDLAGFAVSPDGETVWVSDFQRAALYFSADGARSWTAQPIGGLKPARVWEVALDPASPERVLVATAGGGLHARWRAPAIVSVAEPAEPEGGATAIEVAPAQREEEP